MMSELEQRRIIESAFLPLICRCCVAGDGTLSVCLVDPANGEELHRVTGVARSTLSTSREISRFVLQLRQQLQAIDSTRILG